MSDDKPNQPQPTTDAPIDKTDKLDAEAGGTHSVSLKKVEANRRNARKSTGPRTPAGKQTVSRNAMKHGFFSKHLLVPGGSESQEEYAELRASICRDFSAGGLAGRRLCRHDRGMVVETTPSDTLRERTDCTLARRKQFPPPAGKGGRSG